MWASFEAPTVAFPVLPLVPLLGACRQVQARHICHGRHACKEGCKTDGLTLANVGCSGSGPVVLMFFDEEQPIRATTEFSYATSPLRA